MAKRRKWRRNPSSEEVQKRREKNAARMRKLRENKVFRERENAKASERMQKRRENPNIRALENARSLQRIRRKRELENDMKAARKRIKRATSVNLKKEPEYARAESKNF